MKLWETGEITDLVYLEQLEMERNRKIEGVALFCKELTYFEDNIKGRNRSPAEKKKDCRKCSKASQRLARNGL